MMQRLTDKVALVTGGGRSIGRAMYSRLAQEGADVTRRTDIDQMVRRRVDTMGRIDILMNNASVLRFQDIFDITEADWDFICEVKLKGAFFVMQAVARRMVDQGDGGEIVNTGSVSGKPGRLTTSMAA